MPKQFSDSVWQIKETSKEQPLQLRGEFTYPQQQQTTNTQQQKYQQHISSYQQVSQKLTRYDTQLQPHNKENFPNCNDCSSGFILPQKPISNLITKPIFFNQSQVIYPFPNAETVTRDP